MALPGPCLSTKHPTCEQNRRLLLSSYLPDQNRYRHHHLQRWRPKQRRLFHHITLILILSLAVALVTQDPLITPASRALRTAFVALVPPPPATPTRHRLNTMASILRNIIRVLHLNLPQSRQLNIPIHLPLTRCPTRTPHRIKHHCCPPVDRPISCPEILVSHSRTKRGSISPTWSTLRLPAPRSACLLPQNRLWRPPA